jgi:rod shape-determining protein MreC
LLPKLLLPLFTAAALALFLVPQEWALTGRSWFMSVLRPLLDRVAAARDESVGPLPASGLAGTDSLKTRNKEQLDVGTLARYALQLKAQNVRLLEENARLRAALPGTDTPPAPPSVAADVIAQRIMWREQLWGVNRGEADGVVNGAGVLAEGIVLGRVVAVGSRAASLALLTHRDTAISVRLAESRVSGVLRGTSEEEDGTRVCRLSLIARQWTPRLGEAVATSGLDGVFPAGLWVGVVSKAEQKSAAEWELTVRPATNFDKVSVVRILTAKPAEIPWPDNPYRGKKR